MARLPNHSSYDVMRAQELENDKQKLQNQQEECYELQRELADAITSLKPLDEIRQLIAKGAKPNRPVTQGLHPIHYAAYQNFIPAVRYLIVRGGDVDAMDDNGYTALHLGAERGYYDLLKFLIANGAKVCFTDNKKQSNLNSVADEPLSLALKRGHMDCAELLLKNGADPNVRYFMGSEINLVSILKVSCIKLLLEYGAHPDSRDRSGLTPLMKAARHPQGYATVKLLIDYGADVNDIAGERHDYRTVLHHSIFSGNLDLIRLLLTSGARYPKLNFDKPSPMDITIVSGRYDIAQLLIDFDADVNWGSHTTIGQPLHTALTQKIENKTAIVKLLLDSSADPNSLATSNRHTGPPLHDYLHSLRLNGVARASTPPPPYSQVNGSGQNQSSPSRFSSNSSTSSSSGLSLEIVHLLLMYGARVVLKTATQNRLGLVRTLEKCQEELSLDLLHLLIDAAEEIDWFMMSKVIYSCLRHTNRAITNELFDPSTANEMTPERLSVLLRDSSSHHYGVSESIVKLMNNGKCSSAILTLKQLSRIKIRKYLTEELQLKGIKLIKRLSALPLPNILNRYMLYQILS